MRKRGIGIVLFLLSWSGISGQNLISNGSFETMYFSSCLHDKTADPQGIIPPWFGQVYRIWNLECFWNGNGGCTTPPKAGDRYVSVNLSIGVNGVSNLYLGIELSQPMEAGKEYYFEMNFSDIGFLSEIPKAYRESLGAYFSQSPLNIVGWTYRSEVPHINNTLLPPYGCGEWKQLSSCFKAEGGERYLTIGFFNHPEEIPEGEEALGGFIHVDDIKLISLEALAEVLGDDREFCAGTEISLTLRANNTAVRSFLWQDGSTTPSLQVTEPGLYWVEMENECFTVRDTIEITRSDFAVDLGPDALFCDADPDVLLQGPPDSDFNLWNDTWTQPTLEVSKPGTYWLSASRNGCLASDTITFFADSPLTLNLPRDTTLCQFDLPFSLTANVPEDLVQVTWDDGTFGTIYPVRRAGTYRATVANACGEQSSEVTIEVDDCSCKLYVPNAFSPNGDGTNDRLEAFLACPFSQAESVSWTIFDRWGNQVFSSAALDSGWDGTYRVRALNTGVYIWQLGWQEAIQDGAFQRRTESGEVYLLR